jgi:photosystem II stability/assembly factor-like uncharacterized protein
MQRSAPLRILISAALICSVIIFVPAQSALACNTELHWLNPLPRGETLNAVDIPSSYTALTGDSGFIAYAVGNNGCTIKTYDGGATWVQKSCPVETDLNAVSFIDTSHGWAAGKGGVILKMTDGASYQQQVSGTTSDVWGIFFRNSNRGWACTSAGELLRTENGGSTWLLQDLGDYYFTEVYFVSDTKGYLISGNGDVFISTDGGVTWPTHIDKGDAVSFDDISFDTDDLQIGWIASGNGHPWKTTDGGATWSQVTVGSGAWQSVECVGGGSNIVWMSGWNAQPDHVAKIADSASPSVSLYADSVYGNDMSIYSIDAISGMRALGVGMLGQVTFTNDGGTTWGHRAQTAPRDYLAAVQFLDLRTGYVCSGSSVWKSTDAGTTWAATPTPAGSMLYGLYFINANTGWAVGNSGRILKTVNGGVSWTAQTSGTTAVLEDVYFTDATHGWAAGTNGTLLWTADGGSTWNSKTLGTTALVDIDFFGTEKGAVVGRGGAVYTTSNASTSGGTWTAAAAAGTADWNAVDYAAADALYIGGIERTIAAAGNTTLLKSSTGGASWILAPGDLTRRNVFKAHGSVNQLSFSSGTTGWAALNDGSVAFTTDGGENWQHGTAMDSNTLGISVVGAENIWVCGANGRLMSNYWYQTTKVYRFYNKKNGSHFYTDSYDEKMMIIQKWPDIYTFEGVGYEYDSMKATKNLWRFYNKKNGSHFYTVSDEEKNMVLQKWSTVFALDGPTYPVSPVQVPGSVPVYRFYNKTNGSHFYTASADERDRVMATWPNVFSLDGPAFYLPQ